MSSPEITRLTKVCGWQVFTYSGVCVKEGGVVKVISGKVGYWMGEVLLIGVCDCT